MNKENVIRILMRLDIIKGEWFIYRDENSILCICGEWK